MHRGRRGFCPADGPPSRGKRRAPENPEKQLRPRPDRFSFRFSPRFTRSSQGGAVLAPVFRCRSYGAHPARRPGAGVYLQGRLPNTRLANHAPAAHRFSERRISRSGKSKEKTQMSRPAIPIHLLLLGIAPLACLAQAQPVGSGGPVRLSLKRAVEIALSPEGSARIQLSAEALRQARLRSAEARAALLPDIEGSVTEENLNRNLAAFGLQLSAPLPGFQIPAVVGPFNVFDARATASQSLFDFSSIRRFQASKVAVNAAKADRQNVDNEVSAQVAKAYYAALRSEAALEAANADVALAEALVKQAQDQKTAGTGTGIEITRARVQLANAR